MALSYGSFQKYQKELDDLSRLSRVKKDIYDTFAMENNGRSAPYEVSSYSRPTSKKVSFESDIKGLIMPEPAPEPVPEPVPEPEPVPADVRADIINEAGVDQEFVYKNGSDTTGNITQTGKISFRSSFVGTWNPDEKTIIFNGVKYPATPGFLILLLYKGNSIDALRNHWGKITEQDINHYLYLCYNCVPLTRNNVKIFPNKVHPNIARLLPPAKEGLLVSFMRAGKAKRKYIGYDANTELSQEKIDILETFKPVIVGSGIQKNEKDIKRAQLLTASIRAGNDSNKARAELASIFKGLLKR